MDSVLYTNRDCCVFYISARMMVYEGELYNIHKDKWSTKLSSSETNITAWN